MPLTTTHTRVDTLHQVADWRRAGQRVALVPTMGNLHRGHFSLVERARELADRVVATVFVNPTQFGPNEDFNSYPRTLEADAAGLAAAGCDLLYAPDVAQMYPFGETRCWVEVPALSDTLCGAFRPGHFRGVATVVARLFLHTQPDVAVFGEKDFQQLMVIRHMARDLGFPIEIVGMPTVREANGLAMSSRNQYLTPEERERAALIYRLMREAEAAVLRGEAIEPKLAEGLEALVAAGFKPDYFEARDAESLGPVSGGDIVLLVAARLGKARLIDNWLVRRK